MKLVSWNVNGIRSTEKELLEFLNNESPDFLLIQELKSFPDQLSLFLKMIPGYQSFWNSAERPGYSGTAVFYKDNLPVSNTSTGMGNLDKEGRLVTVELPNHIIIDGYFPNGVGNADRMEYKLEFLDQFHNYARDLKSSGKTLIIGGDFNVCHTEKDLWSTEVYNGRSPFLPVEREWFSKMLELGMVDTYRHINPENERRTWWNALDSKRPESKGLGLDYFIVSDSVKSDVSRAEILKDVYGSDHCPILFEFND